MEKVLARASFILAEAQNKGASRQSSRHWRPGDLEAELVAFSLPHHIAFTLCALTILLRFYYI